AQVVRIRAEIEDLQRRERAAVEEAELSVFGGNDEPVELLDVESGLWVAKAADRMHDPEVVDHLDGAISERADENVAAPSVQAEVIDTAKYTRQHDARAWDERHGAPGGHRRASPRRHDSRLEADKECGHEGGTDDD